MTIINLTQRVHLHTANQISCTNLSIKIIKYPNERFTQKLSLIWPRVHCVLYVINLIIHTIFSFINLTRHCVQCGVRLTELNVLRIPLTKKKTTEFSAHRRSIHR